MNKKLWISALLMGFGIIGMGLYSGLTVRSYKLEMDDVPLGSSVKIVVLTDLHSTQYGNNQKRLLRLIQAEEPDVIMLVGDIVDDHRPVEGTKFLLEGLKDKVPMFYVTGNHEHNIRNLDQVKDFLRSYGVQVLEEEYAKFRVGGMQLIVAGMSDPYKKYPFVKEFYSLSEKVSKEKGIKILLSHRPEYIPLYEKGGYNLVLSGHAHGGQVRIPYVLNGLYSPGQGFFPKYAGGHYKMEADTNFIVSRGLAIYKTLPRIFNPPEIVAITIKGKEK